MRSDITQDTIDYAIRDNYTIIIMARSKLVGVQKSNYQILTVR